MLRIVFEEAAPIRRIGKRKIEDFRVLKRLLHSRADAVVRILRFDDGEGNVALVVQKVVSPLALAALGLVSVYDHAPVGEIVFAFDLGMVIPTRAAKRGIDELRPNILLGHLMHLHQVFHAVSSDSR